MITESRIEQIRAAVKRLQELCEEPPCDHEAMIKGLWRGNTDAILKHPLTADNPGLTLVCGQCGMRLK